jgi:hypothetical protein
MSIKCYFDTPCNSLRIFVDGGNFLIGFIIPFKLCLDQQKKVAEASIFLQEV